MIRNRLITIILLGLLTPGIYSQALGEEVDHVVETSADAAVLAAAMPPPAAVSAEGAAAEHSADPGSASAESPIATSGAAGDNVWIWQGDDNTPVPAPRSGRSNQQFDASSDTGNALHLNGWATLGYDSQTIRSKLAAGNNNLDTSYQNLDTGVGLNATGFLYHPSLVNYTLSLGYQRDRGELSNESTSLNGLSYSGSFSFLRATQFPFQITLIRSDQETELALQEPFRFQSQRAHLAGSMERLPVKLIYDFGLGSGNVGQANGYRTDYHDRTANVAIAKDLGGFAVNVRDDFLGVKYRGNDGVERTQTNNSLRADVNHNFTSNVTLNASADWVKYVWGSQTGGGNTDANVMAYAAALSWRINPKLSTNVSASLLDNAVNTLQLIQSTTGTGIPLSTLTVLDTKTKVVSGTTTYTPWKSWTFGASASYTGTSVPQSLLSEPVTTLQTGFIKEAMSFTGSAGYHRKIWKLNYNALASVSRQYYSLVSGGLNNSPGLGYAFTTGISGGDEQRLAYEANVGRERIDNPVFFYLFGSDNFTVSGNLATRRLRWVRLSAKVQYVARSVSYVGSRLYPNSWNFLFRVDRSNFGFYASETALSQDQVFFGPGSPLLQSGNSTGATPPPTALFVPTVFASNRVDTVGGSWRPLSKLSLDSRYMRTRFTINGQAGTVYTQVWFDNSVRYNFGRFDMIGGYVRSLGQTGTYDQRGNRFYFRLRIPFSIF